VDFAEELRKLLNKFAVVSLLLRRRCAMWTHLRFVKNIGGGCFRLFYSRKLSNGMRASASVLIAAGFQRDRCLRPQRSSRLAGFAILRDVAVGACGAASLCGCGRAVASQNGVDTAALP